MKTILEAKIQKFIQENLNTDISQLLLKKNIFNGVDNKMLVQQIVGWKVASKKFPFLCKENIIFPPHLNLEQASSQQTADFKAIGLSGNHFLDLTCGFGIDALFMSQHFKEVHLVEQNKELSEIVRHNWKILGKKAYLYQQSLEKFLESNTQKYDIIYIDPARRDTHNSKKFLLEDLSPNLLSIQQQLWQISDKILTKLSPLIDLKYLLSTLSFIEKIDIISVKNEVKEIFITQNKEKTENKTICNCVNLESNDPIFTFAFNDMAKAPSPSYSSVKKYIYIPNNALLKSGAFDLIATHFAIEKLHKNTHLYTSDTIISFPGRILECELISAKNIKKGEKYNIICKNYPLKIEEIKKKYKIVEGGIDYLIFTQSIDGKIIIKGKIV